METRSIELSRGFWMSIYKGTPAEFRLYIADRIWDCNLKLNLCRDRDSIIRMKDFKEFIL